MRTALSKKLLESGAATQYRNWNRECRKIASLTLAVAIADVNSRLGFTWLIKFLGDKLLCGHVPDPFPRYEIGSGHARLVACSYLLDHPTATREICRPDVCSLILMHILHVMSYIADTQYMTIHLSKSQKWWTYKPLWQRTVRVFMTNKTPNGARKHRKSTQPNSSKTGQMFFFLLLSFFRRASSMLRQPLALVYARNSSILYRAVHEPIAFSQLQSLTRRS